MATKFLQVILIWVFGIHRFGQATPSTEDLNFVQDAAYKDKIRTNRILQTLSARSRLHCFSRCTGSPACVSLFYNQESHRCQLHDVIFVTPSDGDVASNTKYYKLNRGGNCSVKNGFFYQRSTKMCFKIFMGHEVWNVARKRCNKINMYLVMVNTPEKYFYVKRTVRQSTGFGADNNYYIGLDDQQKKSRFVWSDGSVATWTIWDKNNPPTGTLKRCVMLGGNNLYKSRLNFVVKACTNKKDNFFRWICERKM